MYYQLGQVGCAVERLCGFGKKMAGHKSINLNAQQKARNIKNCD